MKIKRALVNLTLICCYSFRRKQNGGRFQKGEVKMFAFDWLVRGREIGVIHQNID